MCSKVFCVEKSLLLLHATVCHLLVNETELEDRGRWVGKNYKVSYRKRLLPKRFCYASDVLFE